MKLKILIKATALLTVFVLTACSSNLKFIKGSSALEDNKKLGAVYDGRTYTSATYVSTNYIDNQEAVINQGDFLTQLSEVRNYSPILTNSYANSYNKLINWVAAGADTSKLNDFGISIQQLSGQDGYQNVFMTSYYTPILKGSLKPTSQYNTPIYALPSHKRYSRAQIYAGVLKGRGLELAYTTMFNGFAIGVQGSGFMDIGQGQIVHFAYGGQNGYKYVAVGRLLVEDDEISKEKMSMQAIKEWGERNPSRFQSLLERNPSYVYFKRDYTDKPKGAAGVPLIGLASIAVDRSIVPLGSVVLVEVPCLDNDGNWNGKHELRLMVALDVGGAIKGQHFDLYQGIGDHVGETAGQVKHFGRAWILR